MQAKYMMQIPIPTNPIGTEECFVKFCTVW